MLGFKADELDTRTVRWSAFEWCGQPLSCGEVFVLWRSSPDFVAAWSRCLRGLSFAAYCWECPPVAAHRQHHPFECVFIDSPLLASSRADAAAFVAHFKPGMVAVSFPSLGRDAVLVAPCPKNDATDRAHLGRFMTTAPDADVAALWFCVGQALEARFKEPVGRDFPLWLSTAGLGVPWLHVRLDSRPKYYRHEAYQQAPV